MDLQTLARVGSAVLWIAVEYRYIRDVGRLWAVTPTGGRVTQGFLGFLFVLIAFSAVRSIAVALEPSWLTYAFPATALGMVVGQHWEQLTRFLPRNR